MVKSGKYGVLNVVLHPHPENAYRKLFEDTAKFAVPVKYYGDRFAKISPISETRDGVFSGRLATWSEIDTKENLIEKETLNELLFSEADIRLPSGIGFNSRVFSFAFRTSDHRLYVELLNDENQRLTIGAAKKIFDYLLRQRVEGSNELIVHIVSRSSSVDFVLNTPHLRKLEIEVELPNPDVLTPQKQEVLDALNLMKAKKMKVELTRRSGEDHLEVTPGIRAFAELSAENGHSRATGRDDQGNTVERSTDDFPLEVDVTLLPEESRAVAARRVALSE
jgi:hypothetical protein